MRHEGKSFMNLRVGRPHVRPDLPSHVPGVRQGNRPGAIEATPGLRQDPEDRRFAYGTARRSTGINAGKHGPIDPRMPNLSPA